MTHLMIGHRGHKLKDNTINSIKNAIELFDCVEIDVQLTKDKQIFLYHDLIIGNFYTKDLILYDIRNLDNDICTLKEVLSFFPLKNKKLYIDIKGRDNAICHELVELLSNETCNKDNIFLCSFNLSQLNVLKNNSYKTGLITNNLYTTDMLDIIIRKYNISILVIECYYLTDDIVNYVHSKNMSIFTYTCTNLNDLVHILKFNIDGIVSNISY